MNLFDLDYSDDSVWKTISDICVAIGFNANHYLPFRDTGGFDYLIDKISSDYFLSNKKIKSEIRKKLLILSRIENTRIEFSNLFRINEKLKCKLFSFERSKYEKEKIQLIEMIETSLRSKDERTKTS